MEKFKEITYINKQTILSMLKFDDKKTGSHIWKITAIQVLASAIEYSIPINDDILYSNLNNKNPNKQSNLFILSWESNLDVLPFIIKLCDNHRTQVQSATVEWLGKIMQICHEVHPDPTKIMENKIYRTSYDYASLMSISTNEKVCVNAIFRISMHYSLFINKKEIFNHALHLLKKTKQKQRNWILNSWTQFISDIVIRLNDKTSKNELNDLMYIDDIYYTLYQSTELIFVDPNDELIINIISLIKQLLIMKDRKYSEGWIKVINKIKKEIKDKDDITKEWFYNFLIECFNVSYSYDNEWNEYILNVIIISFDKETDKELLSTFVSFFNSNNKGIIPSDPVDRFIYILSKFNKETIEYEGKLIQLLNKLILVLVYTSADYELNIYDKGLEECVYKDLNINTTGYYLNRSQPWAPSLWIKNSLDEAYETLVSASWNGFNNSQMNGMIKATIDISTQSKVNVGLETIGEKMEIDDVDEINTNTNTSNNRDNSLKTNTTIKVYTQRDLTLSQHSSLVNSTSSYPSMSTDNKNVTWGHTHGEAFKIPYPVWKNKAATSNISIPNISSSLNKTIRQPQKRFGSFFNDNDISYTPIENSLSNKIRFIPDGAHQKQNSKNKRQTKNEIWISRWIAHQTSTKKNQVKLWRKYRVGDLPDIWIKNKDIWEPLLAVCNYNEEISSELFWEIILSIYKESISQNKNAQVEGCIERILKAYSISNYLVINSWHRMIFEFMKENSEYIPNWELIKRTGLASKNYHSAILIFEEFLFNNSTTLTQGLGDKNKIEKKKIGNNVKESHSMSTNNLCDIHISDTTKEAWAYLLKFYSQLRIEDTQIGLIQNFSLANKYYVKEDNDFLENWSYQLTKPNESLYRNMEKSNWLKATFNLIPSSKKDDKINHLRAKYNQDIFIESSLKEVIEDYALTSCSDLGEWDNIANYLLKPVDETISSSSINYLKSAILSSKTSLSLDFTDESLAHYYSLYYANIKDFDRAYLFFQKSKTNFYKTWLNLGAYYNNDLKHELISDIQKIYEIGEFLNFIKGTSATNHNLSHTSAQTFNWSDVGIRNIISLYEKWLNRWPNYIYDPPSAYQEVISIRQIIGNIFKSRIGNYEQIVQMNPILETFNSREHIEVSKCMYKKQFLDFAEIHIKTALLYRKDNAYANSFIVYPVMKNKCKWYEIEAMSHDYSTNTLINSSVMEGKFDKFLKILNSQLESKHLNEETQNKLLSLQVKILLNMTMMASSNVNNEAHFDELFNRSKRNFMQWESKLNTSVTENNTRIYYKWLRPIIKFCDYVLRNTQIGNQKTMNEIYTIYMEYGLKNLSCGDEKMINIIPKLFDLWSKNEKLLENIFLKYSMKVNISYYLKWKHQWMAYVNTSISNWLFPIIENIWEQDSQSLFYSFTTIEKYSDIFNNNNDTKNSDWFDYIKGFYNHFTSLNSLVEALDCWTNPEHRLQFWLTQIQKVIMECNENNEMAIQKVKNIWKAIDYDVLTTNKTYIGNKIGSYNMKFIKDYKQLIESTVNIKNIEKVITQKGLTGSERKSLFNKLVEKVIQATNKSISSWSHDAVAQLSTFNEWWSQYECNEFLNSESYIVLPSWLNNNSTAKNRIMISSFDQHILVLSSIRCPKRIIMYGNDEKSYSYLIKGCEDLRLDQRIEEIFKVMNDILVKDSTCAKKKIKWNTFDVVSITRKLGMIEWISNTQPLFNILKYSMQNWYGEKDWDVKSSAPQMNRWQWLNNHCGKTRPIHEQHLIGLSSDKDDEIIKGFKLQENLLPKSVLQKAWTHFLVTPEEIITTKINFIRNFSALNIAGYILGIGDRHLDNFLINVKTCEIIGIDFGISFDQGITSLIIPEWVPFRLTNQIKNVISPFGVRGIIRQTMVDCLSAFKLMKNYILDYCEVFIKEPLLDWEVKKEKNEDNSNSATIKNWIPMKKVEIVKKKLSGVNPIIITNSEVNEGIFPQKAKDVVVRILCGSVDSWRMLNKDKLIVDVETQIDMLNEQATDPNLLGRMWVGWSPFI